MKNLQNIGLNYMVNYVALQFLILESKKSLKIYLITNEKSIKDLDPKNIGTNHKKSSKIYLITYATLQSIQIYESTANIFPLRVLKCKCLVRTNQICEIINVMYML